MRVHLVSLLTIVVALLTHITRVPAATRASVLPALAQASPSAFIPALTFTLILTAPSLALPAALALDRFYPSSSLPPLPAPSASQPALRTRSP